MFFLFFFFNDTATTEIYTLSLHDALPICDGQAGTITEPMTFPNNLTISPDGSCVYPNGNRSRLADGQLFRLDGTSIPGDRKSTRLNSSHSQISYAVFCLKKKKKTSTVVHNLVSSKSKSEVTIEGFYILLGRQDATTVMDF